MNLSASDVPPTAPSPAFSGQMEELIAAHDWATTPLGAMAQWSASLKVTLQTVLASPFPMVLAWGPELVTLHNEAYRQLLGAKPAALGEPFLTVWPEARDALVPLFDRALSGEACRFESAPFSLRRADKPEMAVFDFSLSPVRDEAGAVVGVLNICVEITERAAFERQLRQSEARLRDLNDTLEQQVAERTAERDRMWDTSPDLMLVIDFNGVFRRVNPAWTSVLGYRPDELVDHHVNDFVLPDDHSATTDAYERTAYGDLAAIENKYRHKDGSVRWIAWVAAPAGDMTYATGRDITAEKERAEQLLLAQEQLRQSQKMEAMGQLTGGVAHDFNNLLTPIIGSLDMLARREVGTAREQRLIDGALQSAERAKTLVHRLLAFGRRQPLQSIAIDLKQLVGGMTDLFDSTVGPRVEVRVDLSDDLRPVRADPNQLEMAILNLAVNARDAMPEGGLLTISADPQAVRVDDGSPLREGDYVRLSIADNGLGMDDRTRVRAIEPFFSTKGVGKGTGLGLSMVHGLASQLGGDMTIDSTLGGGTKIALWLPVSAVSPTVASEAPHATPAIAARGTALLVDDEELVRMTTAEMLVELGYEVIQAASGEEALGRLDEDLALDVLVTDHLMPGLTGADLARRVQSSRPDLPILVVSGYAEAEGIPPGLARLTKPFRTSELAAGLAALRV